ncbi:MAG: bifunctional N(6)-L-threonylcarbamoyladenine synthase/serine/threonine protein kinase [Thermoplasmata archaeon]
MLVLGIESTAHTASVGLVEDGEIKGVRSDSYRPLTGGINPRDAAEHHRSVFPDLLSSLLNEENIEVVDLDKIAISIGPGLGPSLKVGVELARYLSVRYSKDLVPVNHGVGHLEIARKMSGFENPLFLYVSGGNTQLVSIGEYRYSVLGETLDIGVGNFLDKIARDLEIPFPGAPVLENLAKGGEKVLDCPYTVRGMDVSYSGLYTSLKKRIRTERREDIAFNAQEYAFTALAEIVERGMAHFGLTEFSITGGVARNRRLRELLSGMAKMRGYRYYFPDDTYLSDNGAMIALAGYMSNLKADENIRLEQTDRVDSRESRWIGRRKLNPRAMVGGESVIERSTFEGIDCVVKRRRGREYRNPEINLNINNSRIKREIRILHALDAISLKTPEVLFVDMQDSAIYLKMLPGRVISQMISEPNFDEVIELAGEKIAQMHNRGISHGDLNLGNIMFNASSGEMSFIDPSMGDQNAEIEQLGVDVHLMKESLKSLGKDKSFKYFLEGYSKCARFDEVMKKVIEIEYRRRYT